MLQNSEGLVLCLGNCSVDVRTVLNDVTMMLDVQQLGYGILYLNSISKAASWILFVSHFSHFWMFVFVFILFYHTLTRWSFYRGFYLDSQNFFMEARWGIWTLRKYCAILCNLFLFLTAMHELSQITVLIPFLSGILRVEQSRVVALLRWRWPSSDIGHVPKSVCPRPFVVSVAPQIWIGYEQMYKSCCRIQF